MESVYSREELLSMGPQRSLSGDATEAAFLLGGIGTGNVSVGARGEFRDWELFNSPGKGNRLPYTFFAVRAEASGSGPVAKVLESRLKPPYSGSHGFRPGEVAGLPRLDGSTMRAEYPFVWIDFVDDDLPVDVTLEAFTPFIPLNADESGIPGAVLRYRVRNSSDGPVDVTIAGSLANAVGFNGYGLFFDLDLVGTPKNHFADDGDRRGIIFGSADLPPDHLKFGSMALVTRDPNVTVSETWLKGYWWDSIQDFWDDFRTDGRLELHSESIVPQGALSVPSKLLVGTLGIFHAVQPGEERVFEFMLTWYFPNRPRAWQGHVINLDTNAEQIERNYYSTLFVDAWDVARYLGDNLPRLEQHSRDFQKALFSSSLPTYVIDAVASNITVLRSTTCFRIADGTFLGWEGSFDKRGCCEGSCTHVWNYAQTLAFLFPELERSMRRVEFLLETDDSGKMSFRTNRVFGGPRWEMLPAVDGQLGTIIRLCREWKLSGDVDFLKAMWPKARQAMEFAFSYWDRDGDFLLEGEQHNTYDIEFYGPTPLANSMFLAALAAAAEIAQYLGEPDLASRYRQALQVGSELMDEQLWNGEYYVQAIDDVDAHRYQYGPGCLSDQLLGQLLAHVCGLGYLLPRDHVRTAIRAVYRHNFSASLKRHNAVQRTYALNDERGLVLCSWPYGGRPRFPFPYADEIWTGVEYQVAAHLIYEGFLEEGLTIVKAVRERYDGYRRNPWNEVECGNHYARSMASWAVYTALLGFRCDLAMGRLDFNPAIQADNFSAFWCTGRAWGTYQQEQGPNSSDRTWELKVLYGSLEGVEVNGRLVGSEATVRSASTDAPRSGE